MDLQKQKKIAEEKLKEIDDKLKKKSKLKSSGKTRFYCFSQNNSGGTFVNDDDVCEYVIIEAHSVEEANLLADNFGIYFDGCNQGIDCGCCGDRWNEVDKSDGSIKPEIYGEDVRKMYSSSFRSECIIHYLNGKRERIVLKTEKDCPKHQYEQRHNIGRRCKICGKWE